MSWQRRFRHGQGLLTWLAIVAGVCVVIGAVIVYLRSGCQNCQARGVVEKTRVCHVCRGYKMLVCQHCGGTGQCTHKEVEVGVGMGALYGPAISGGAAGGSVKMKPCRFCGLDTFCHLCRGWGRVVCTTCYGLGTIRVKEVCPVCNGKGRWLGAVWAPKGATATGR